MSCAEQHGICTVKKLSIVLAQWCAQAVEYP